MNYKEQILVSYIQSKYKVPEDFCYFNSCSPTTNQLYFFKTKRVKEQNITRYLGRFYINDNDSQCNDAWEFDGTYVHQGEKYYIWKNKETII